jgi:hypothetical protein
MIGMPTPTCVPSLICKETCTGRSGFGAAEVVGGALVELTAELDAEVEV